MLSRIWGIPSAIVAGQTKVNNNEVEDKCLPGLDIALSPHPIWPTRTCSVSYQMKVILCGEEKAPFPIKVEDVEAELKTEYIQLVPGSRDIEGRQARRAAEDCYIGVLDRVIFSCHGMALPSISNAVESDRSRYSASSTSSATKGSLPRA